MKIFGIGLNYTSHKVEMKQDFETKDPVFFMMPDTALLQRGHPFFLPDFSNDIQYETEVVVKISRLGKSIPERFAHRYYEELTVGIDFTARDLQRQQKQLGMPWEISKCFDKASPLGHFISKHDLPDVNNLNFHLDINNQTVQQGNTADMLYSIDRIIAYLSQYFTLKMGDLIFTGTPAGVGNVAIDDHLQGYLEGHKLLDFKIK